MIRWPLQKYLVWRLNHKQAMILLFIISFLLNSSIGALAGLPLPSIHDEFGYLLTADTFAHGRLTNDTHPFWEHFQTFHVFFHPTYQAKFFPAQGFTLMIGQLLAGFPIAGVWLTMAFAVIAIYWMLCALFAPSWAFTGALIVLFNPVITRNWSHSYWGGGVALLGGALVFGAAFRFSKRLNLGDTICLGIGVVLLANSRPFEGLIACFCAAFLFLAGIHQWWKAGEKSRLLRSFFLPLSVILISLAAWTLFYNQQLTGSPWMLPWNNWWAKDATIPLINTFIGSDPHPLPDLLYRYWRFFLGPILSAAFMGYLIHWTHKRHFRELDRNFLVALVSVPLLMVFSLNFSRAWPHYLAPVVALIYVLLVQGLIYINQIARDGKSYGRYLVILLLAGYFGVSAFWLGLDIAYGQGRTWANERADIAQKLLDDKGRDLVFVQYASNHNRHAEWVYNSADIDSSEIVWARQLSSEKDEALIKYFADRKVWLLNADAEPPDVTLLKTP